jgi:hypothetical protein
MSLPTRVRNEAREGPRRRRDLNGLADDAAGHEIGVAIVIERDYLRLRAGGALERNVHRGRMLVPAMTTTILSVFISSLSWSDHT